MKQTAGVRLGGNNQTIKMIVNVTSGSALKHLFGILNNAPKNKIKEFYCNLSLSLFGVLFCNLVKSHF